MSLKNSQEFQDIISDIINNEQFQKLDTELHHGISRLNHSIRVAKYTYKISKKLKWDFKKVTRAALLHDFFFDAQLESFGIAKTWCKHPEISIQNARQYFEIDEVQENIIISHMFPSCKIMPKYKSSWLVTCVDKCVSFYEMYRFKASLVLGIWTIFLFNMVTIQK
jgi:uncharacterized protein